MRTVADVKKARDGFEGMRSVMVIYFMALATDPTGWVIMDDQKIDRHKKLTSQTNELIKELEAAVLGIGENVALSNEHLTKLSTIDSNVDKLVKMDV